MESIECIVIGAGVVGLSIAAKLSEKYEVLLVESHNKIGSETSARNSEVIHSGIYYEPGSLKAKLCVSGNRMLYEYCEQRNIDYEKCGKLIVATSEDELLKLENLKKNGENNGLNDLDLLSKKEVEELENEIFALGAIYSPNTGIIDSHQFMLSLQGDFERNGGLIAFNSHVTKISNLEEKFRVFFNDDNAGVESKMLINSAGLTANHIAKNFEKKGKYHAPKLYMAKGNYFSATGKCPFKRLIYPLPNQAGLGVHLTFDLSKRMKFGPDVEWVKDINYDVNTSRSDDFKDEIMKFWPNFNGELFPDYSGIRPKLVGEGFQASDFKIEDKKIHGINGLINLFGIESPGLTSSLAIANYVNDMLKRS